MKWLDFCCQTFEVAAAKLLTLYDEGPSIQSNDNRFCHDSFTMIIFCM